MGTVPRYLRRTGTGLDQELTTVWHLFLWAFGFRFSLGIIGWILTSYFSVPLFQDALYYEELGHYIAQEWLAGHSSEWLQWLLTSNSSIWILPFTIACVYWISGGLRLMPLLIAGLCLLTSWTPVIVYRISRRLGLSLEGSLFAGRLIAFSPAFAFWSGAPYKEGLIVLLLSLSLLHILRLQTGVRWGSMLVVCGCLTALFGLRSYIAALMSAVLWLGLMVGRGQRPGSAFIAVSFRQLFVAIAFSGLLIWSGLTQSTDASLPRSVQEALTRISTSRRDLAQAPSGFRTDVTFTTASDALEFLPTGMAYFLFAPAPWQFGNLRQSVVIPETVFWICLYPFVYWGIRRGIKRNPQGMVPLVAAAISMSTLYALFAGNIGVVYRMRIQVWLILAVFIGWGWEARQERKLERARNSALRRQSLQHANPRSNTSTVR